MSSLSLMSLSELNYAPAAGVFISLGSNLGFGDFSSHAVLERALERLDSGGDKIIATSSFWRSDAWPAGTGAPDFINAVCCVRPQDTEPALLLARLHEIEAEFGRLRDHQNRWSARTLDLDLLDYNGLISKINSKLVLPHPRIVERDFVLKPLLEISPNWVHPIIKKNGEFLLAKLVKDGQTNNCRPVSF